MSLTTWPVIKVPTKINKSLKCVIRRALDHPYHDRTRTCSHHWAVDCNAKGRCPLKASVTKCILPTQSTLKVGRPPRAEQPLLSPPPLPVLVQSGIGSNKRLLCDLLNPLNGWLLAASSRSPLASTLRNGFRHFPSFQFAVVRVGLISAALSSGWNILLTLASGAIQC